MFKKGALFFGLSLIIHLYTTLVLTILWNWFVVPAFHVSDISFWLMYGLVLIVSMFSNPSDQSLDADRRTKSLMIANRSLYTRGPERVRQRRTRKPEQRNLD
jgi:hypothetical protein